MKIYREAVGPDNASKRAAGSVIIIAANTVNPIKIVVPE